MTFITVFISIAVFLVVLTERVEYKECDANGVYPFESVGPVPVEQFPDDPVEIVLNHIPAAPVSPKYINKICTPSCVAKECTRECKCAYTHTEIHATCSEPASLAIAKSCLAWYRRCPIFKAVSY
uniref:Uncharacterized protein n=1 Tax=Panagrolaimus davidi TaxID=227884 RepID=A0A914QHW2_9BILA